MPFYYFESRQNKLLKSSAWGFKSELIAIFVMLPKIAVDCWLRPVDALSKKSNTTKNQERQQNEVLSCS